MSSEFDHQNPGLAELTRATDALVSDLSGEETPATWVKSRSARVPGEASDVSVQETYGLGTKEYPTGSKTSREEH